MSKPKPELPSAFLGMAVPASLVEAIDDYRFAHRLPSRSAAARRLLEAGLTALSPKRKEKADG